MSRGRLLLIVPLIAGVGACADLAEQPSVETTPSQLQPEHLPVARGTYRLPAEGDVIGQLQVVVSRGQDTLLEIARHFDLGYNEIKAANPGVDPWLPGDGTPIVVPTLFVLPDGPREGIVVNVSAMRLFYFPDTAPGEIPVVVTHPVGVGRVGWRTPVGETKIIKKTERPAWYPPASVRKEHAEAGDPLPAVVPPGPDNPLGEYSMRLGWHEYLLHGTNKPGGIGMRVSHGCIRLYPEDIEALFPQVPEGAPVRIVRESYSAGWRDGRLVLAAHAPFEEDRPEPGQEIVPATQAIERRIEQRPVEVDWHRVRSVVAAASGYPVGVSRDSPRRETMIATAPRVENPLGPTESSPPPRRSGFAHWFGTTFLSSGQLSP